MFDNLRQAFREAVDNFRTELNRDRIPEEADRLLRHMEEETARARVDNRKLRDEIRRALEEADREEEARATCRRRETLAREIGDEETARVAEDFAHRHEERRDVLRRKALALRDELRVREKEVEEMSERLEDARKRRAGLAASAGRTRSREAIREADGLFDELDRMAERVADMEARAGAAEEMSALARDEGFGPGPGLEDEEPRPTESSVEADLEELKRRMGMQ